MKMKFVVSCCDCIHYEDGFCNRHDSYVKENDFCSYGETHKQYDAKITICGDCKYYKKGYCIVLKTSRMKPYEFCSKAKRIVKNNM